MPASMHGVSFTDSNCVHTSIQQQPQEHWQTFEEMLQGLHKSGIYIHPEQLAEFLLSHGLPVNLCYVPKHLQQKAKLINEKYQGDLARLEETTDEPYWDFSWYL